MSQPVLLKVYGNLCPASKALADAINEQCRLCADAPVAALDDNLLRISFEGIWFPVDEVLQLVQKQLTPAQTGKLDALDLEDWKLYRHVFQNGEIISRSMPLNNVLDYSGH